MNKSPTISLTIIGHNEEYHLRELLPALGWATEIIYVDCESTDNSAQTAASLGCRVFHRENNPNLNNNKAFAMEQAAGDWIFYLDPDQRLPQNLIAEIRKTIASGEPYKAYTLNRRNFYFGRWLRYGSQYPDLQLRLIRRGQAEFPRRHVHEKLQVSGPVGHLSEDFEHHPYLSISQYLHKFDFYTGFEANFLYENGKRPGIALAFRYWFSQPLSRFLRRYFLKMGFRDGWPGLFAAYFDSLNFIVRYFKLLEIHLEAKKQTSYENK